MRLFRGRHAPKRPQRPGVVPRRLRGELGGAPMIRGTRFTLLVALAFVAFCVCARVVMAETSATLSSEFTCSRVGPPGPGWTRSRECWCSDGALCWVPPEQFCEVRCVEWQAKPPYDAPGPVRHRPGDVRRERPLHGHGVQPVGAALPQARPLLRRGGEAVSAPKPLIVLLGPASRYTPKVLKSLDAAGYCALILDSLDQVRVVQPLEVPERELFAKVALQGHRGDRQHLASVHISINLNTIIQQIRFNRKMRVSIKTMHS